MYLICIESSKTRGMGHLFRSLLYADYLKKVDIPFIFLINEDKKAIGILKSKNIPYLIVDYSDNSDWQTAIIKRNNVNVWIQDKFETSLNMAQNIVRNNVLFCAIDEFGPGAEICDIHFAGMIYLTGYEIRGRRIYSGTEYVILNPETDQYKRTRTAVKKIVVSLGGSDPYGNTVKIVEELSRTGYYVEVIVGPSFDYHDELSAVNTRNYPILSNVPSLIKEFSRFDFAISGGGVTCCEANSCGIPCMIVANAPHEINTGLYLQRKGSAIFGGSYEKPDFKRINEISQLDIENMSKSGMKLFDSKGVDRIFTIIEKEIKYEG